MQRSFDAISHDLARMNINSTILVDRSGFVGEDGETHQGIYDESFLINTPNIVLTMPSNVTEAYLLFNESFNNHGPFFIRFPRNYVSNPKVDNNDNISFGKWILKKKSESNNIVILAIGPLQNELLKLINDNNVDASFYNCLYLKPYDEQALIDCLKYKNIVIYNPYSTKGGFASFISTKLIEYGYKGITHIYSISDEFIKQGTIVEQLEKYHLTPEQIIDDIKKI